MKENPPPRTLAPSLLLAVFCSGTAGLMYQVLWIRMLSTTLGSTTWAACTVLSIFMAGLGLGGVLFGRMADRGPSALKLYARLEALLALYCVITPWLLRRGDALTAALVMAPGALLMGGTLPALARHAAQAGCALGAGISGLYFWNTFGAFTGTLASGLVLVPLVGVTRAVFIAAGLSLAAAAIAWRSQEPAGQTAPSKAPSVKTAAGRPIPKALWALFALSGVTGLAYEILWTRLLALVLGSAIYSLIIILAAFLLGLALGAWLIGVYFKQGRRATPTLLGSLSLGVALSSWAVLLLYAQLPYAYFRLYAWVGAQPAAFAALKFGLAFSTLLVPAVLMGMIFPCLAEMVALKDQEGALVGAAYCANALGAAAGPWIAGFALIPSLGLAGGACGLIALNLLLALWAAGSDPDRKPFGGPTAWTACVAALLLLLFRPGISPAVLQSGVSIYAGTILKDGAGRQAWRKHLEQHELIFAEDGIEASVSVWKGVNGIKTLITNGKPEASDTLGDMPTQIFVGHLPMLMAPNVSPQSRALVIGVGSGVTLAAAARYPAETIDVVEIEAAVLKGASYFEHVNRKALSDPRVAVTVDDAASYLRRSSTLYDAILSEPSNPWLSHVAHLFTLEFYALARKHLTPGGIFCHWVHLYEMPPEALVMALNTFRAAFPEVLVWRQGADLVLIGSEAPLALDWAKLQRRLDLPGVRQDLAPMGISQPYDVLARWMFTQKGLAALAASISTKIHTDDRPLLEYLAPRGLGDKTLLEKNAALLESFAEPISPLVVGAGAQAHWIARALFPLGRAEAISRELDFLSPQDPWHAGMHRDLGELFMRQGKLEKAAEVFEDRLKARPADPAAWLDAARARLWQGKYQAALKPLARFADKLPPGDPLRPVLAKARKEERPALAFMALGLAYSRINQGHTAAAAFSKAVELEPTVLDNTR